MMPRNLRKSVTLYGLENYSQVIDEVTGHMLSETDRFNTRLVLSEALVNAYMHGNRMDQTKPIRLDYRVGVNSAVFKIKDCGPGPCIEQIPEVIPEERILDEKGRGLFLIKQLARRMECKNGRLCIEMKLYDPR